MLILFQTSAVDKAGNSASSQSVILSVVIIRSSGLKVRTDCVSINFSKLMVAYFILFMIADYIFISCVVILCIYHPCGHSVCVCHLSSHSVYVFITCVVIVCVFHQCGCSVFIMCAHSMCMFITCVVIVFFFSPVWM